MQRRAPAVGHPIYRVAAIEGTDEKARTIRFIASDESVDRYGDIVRADGWNLDAFRKNPVLLWAHQSRELPIGRVVKIGVEGKQLMAEAEFAPAEMNPNAEQVFRMVKAGFLNATSVGFLPTVEPNILRDEKNEHMTGYEFVGQALMELSVVPVPANTEALAVSRSFFKSTDDFFRTLITDERSAAAAVAHGVRIRETEMLRRKYSGRGARL